MNEKERLVQHISDTALWAAMHRARETERPDAQFRDPFARRLAGERGEKIAEALAVSEADSWSWMARTYLFDQFITERVRDGADFVVNLGAGLDTRPYRMSWPDSLTWVEVDLPGILDYKEEILAGEKPRCRLERVRLDLADLAARREFLRSVASRATTVLVITEGVTIYLTAEDAEVLARDLAVVPAIRYWVLDIVSPGLLRMLREKVQREFSANATPLQFAPANGPDFFADHGWKAVDIGSLFKTAGRLNRLPESLKPFVHFPEDPVRMGDQPWSGVCLLEQTK